MAIVLKSREASVVDSLRAARKADDEYSKLQENSWEHQRSKLAALVESADWRHGPAKLLATFPHHVLVKAPNGAIVQVEWHKSSDNMYALGRSVIHEMATPVADLGREIIETAKAAVDHILVEDYEASAPMIASIAEALDSGGDLQRRIINEVTIRSLKRDAWWHHVVGDREGIEDKIPQPRMEDDTSIAKSANDLLLFLTESAKNASESLRTLANSRNDRDIESLAYDIVEDTRRAIDTLTHADLTNPTETLQLYEAVMAATPRLLNGIAFLGELTRGQKQAVEG